MGPVKAFTLRYYVSRSVEELAIALRNLENQGRVAKVMALVPEPEAFYVVPDEVSKLNTQNREDRKLRILTQSDPYVSRFIWEVRSVLDRGWYLPVFKGVDPIGKVLMFKINDYLEIKDMHIPYAYLDEFCSAFEKLLDNHSDQLVDVVVLSQFNGVPVTELEEDSRNALEGIGFKLAGERMIRGELLTHNLVRLLNAHYSTGIIFTKTRGLKMKFKHWIVSKKLEMILASEVGQKFTVLA